jgi:hypothetical protein
MFALAANLFSKIIFQASFIHLLPGTGEIVPGGDR